MPSPSSVAAPRARQALLPLVTLSAVALLGLAGTATTAGASSIVYNCGVDLCSANPDTGAKAQITTDGAGAAGRYRFPSVSRDGKRIAALRGNDVMVGDYGTNLTTGWTAERDIGEVELSPDGAAVGESHSFVQNVNRFRCYPFGGCGLELVLEDFSATAYVRGGVPVESGGRRSYRGGGGVGFLGNGALLSSYYSLDTKSHTVCVVANPGPPDQRCEPRITLPNTLTSPTGSPDSRLIAVTVGDPAPAETSSVQLFDAATGAGVRKLADHASTPTFSPDGKQVAYAAADGWIHVVPTAGGASHRLVQGLSPSWGGGDPPGETSAAGALLRSTTLHYRKGRIAIKLRCAGGSTCKGMLRVKKGRTTLGSRKYRVKAGKSGTVSVKPTSRGKRTLSRARKHTITVQLKPAKGTAIAKKLTLRR